MRIMRIEVPERAVVGQSYQLKCIFELEGSDLNSVKWYRNESEFYRFEPKRSPKFKYFPLPGITINVSGCCVYVYTTQFIS
ncbi:hypothetical protein B4U80_08892 [Leptotrombidium deliense]|uniref:Ig-like domain-containing protein n=1 Tax=Leptotrombidium deliense TaxID=299467 RepID=A0A443SF95_9ACAR|nr:hypothetical protein B4U80_08892 [Leptotrombidium deliense]